MEPWVKLGADKKHRGFDIAQKVSPECVQGSVFRVWSRTKGEGEKGRRK